MNYSTYFKNATQGYLNCEVSEVLCACVRVCVCVCVCFKEEEKTERQLPLTCSGLDPRNKPNIETREVADSPITCDGHKDKRDTSTIFSSRSS